jgi:hypothetical protein
MERYFAATSASTYGSSSSLFLAKEEIDGDDSKDSLAVTTISGFIQPNTAGFRKPRLLTTPETFRQNYARTDATVLPAFSTDWVIAQFGRLPHRIHKL